MTAFDGAHEHWCRDRDLLTVTGAITEPPPIRRRHVGKAIAKWIAAVAIATAAAWLLSDLAVAALLDEARLAALGIVP